MNDYTILDRIASAETSSDLSHKPHGCDVDVLKAIALACIRNPAYMAVYRVKYANDKKNLTNVKDMPAAKEIFILWARKSMVRRKIIATGASRLGCKILTQWIDDTCRPCNGLKYTTLDSAPVLSIKPCQACSGTGKTPIKAQSAQTLEVCFDVIDRADAIILTIQRMIKEKLRGVK